MFAEYSPSKALIDAHFIAAGVRLTHTERIEFDPVSLTPEQRAVLVHCEMKSDYKTNAAYYAMPERTTGVRQMYRDSGEARYDTERADQFDTLPTIADWITRAADALASREPFVAEFERLSALHHEQVRSASQAEIDSAVATMRQRIANRSAAGVLAFGPSPIVNAQRAGVQLDMSAWETVVREYRALERTFEAERTEREAAEKAAAEAAKAAERAERLAWARERGSDRLRRNLELGHDCKRLYVIERAGVEFPGYVPDIEKNAEWKPVVCASTRALDERDAVLAAHPELIPEQVTIEWLTCEPRARKFSAEQTEYFDNEFEPCECIAVDSPDYDCWLVKMM